METINVKQKKDTREQSNIGWRSGGEHHVHGRNIERQQETRLSISELRTEHKQSYCMEQLTHWLCLRSGLSRAQNSNWYHT